MSREINVGSRRFWIVSEPFGELWKAQVVEVLEGGQATSETGIQSTGETRSAADERAAGQLHRRLRELSI